MIAMSTSRPRRKFVTAVLSFSRAMLCLIVISAVVAGCEAYTQGEDSVEADGNIREYENNIFTNQGQSTVAGFVDKLKRAEGALAAVESLTVYVGYHGTETGEWCADFSPEEKVDVANLGKAFPKATLEWISDSGLSADAIRIAVGAGNVFFTWCDSDTRVNTVMGENMPKLVKEFK